MSLNVVTAPKTDMFRFRINPEVKEEVEAVYERQGLTLTQAINIFIQQSLNVGGLPFEANRKSEDAARKAAEERLRRELEEAERSGPGIPEEEVYARFGWTRYED